MVKEKIGNPNASKIDEEDAELLKKLLVIKTRILHLTVDFTIIDIVRKDERR